jgi:membrane protease YdiL (CAAX protease family)
MASRFFQFGELGRGLAGLDVMDVLVSLLVFAIIFAVLEKTKILGEEKRNLNVGLALIFALIFIIPHLTGSYGRSDPVEIVKEALPQVSLVIVAIIALMILIGVFAHDRVFLGLTAPGWVAFFSIIAIVFIFGSAAGWWASGFVQFLEDVFGSDALAVVIMIIIFGIIIAFITGGDERKEVGALKRIGVNLGELFRGGGGGHH